MKNISHHGSSLTHHCRTSTAVHCPELTSSPHPPDHLHSPAAGRNLGSHLLRSDNSSSAVPISLAVPMSLFVCLALFFVISSVCLLWIRTYILLLLPLYLLPSTSLFHLSPGGYVFVYLSLSLFFSDFVCLTPINTNVYPPPTPSLSPFISFHPPLCFISLQVPMSLFICLRHCFDFFRFRLSVYLSVSCEYARISSSSSLSISFHPFISFSPPSLCFISLSMPMSFTCLFFRFRLSICLSPINKHVYILLLLPLCLLPSFHLLSFTFPLFPPTHRLLPLPPSSSPLSTLPSSPLLSLHPPPPPPTPPPPPPILVLKT